MIKRIAYFFARRCGCVLIEDSMALKLLEEAADLTKRAGGIEIKNPYKAGMYDGKAMMCKRFATIITIRMQVLQSTDD